MPKHNPQNPIQAAVRTWLKTQQPPADQEAETWEETLLSSAPKRFVIYEPMALLPSGSFSKPVWIDVLEACATDSRVALWTLLLQELSLVARSPLTNLAINEGIPLRIDDDSGAENVLRSPTGLRMLHGDFGPPHIQGATPTRQDFDDAFWVSTKQNGMRQTWAPRWTMFSRGNVKEKARLLGFKGGGPAAASGTADQQQPWAVDLYAGIGYFAFSYASLGMRVLCWEMNPWSVEGLRRGARANGWGVRVVGDAADLARPDVEALLAGGERIVVFAEDNRRARERMRRLRRDGAGAGVAANVVHVNGGLLPTSEPTWEASWEVARRSAAPRTWLHLHENVGVHDIAARRAEIEGRFMRWNEAEEAARAVTVSHVERVKTFAPGVWHCVFDVCIEAPQV